MNDPIARKIKDFSLNLYEPIVPRDLDLGEPLAPQSWKRTRHAHAARDSCIVEDNGRGEEYHWKPLT